jgi:hypothetical protein
MDHPTVKLGFGPAAGDEGVCAIAAAVNTRQRTMARRRTGISRRTDILWTRRASASEMPDSRDGIFSNNSFNHSAFDALCAADPRT